MRILISNDDGIDAPGIRALCEVMAPYGELIVVAPNQQRSASSHGISLHHPLYVEQVDYQLEGVSAYSVSGTPVDCVKWAIVLHGQGKPFDLMLSGINEGSNLATDVLYSGTVAAAGEAALQGIPAIALSLVGPPFHFAEAAPIARDVVRYFANEPFPADTFLSVNLPSVDLKCAKWQVTKLGARGYKNEFIQKIDANGRVYYQHSGEELEELSGDDVDVKVIHNGNISITPLRYRFTNESFLDSLKSSIAKRNSIAEELG